MLKSTKQPYIEKTSCLDCDHHWPDKVDINNS